ncbi:MAG: flavodoxin family protein [Candidatus Pacebacteria bacterium]|nr:flavodoxin family protein [Candidatus Paceibacterota bacterium]
MKTLIIYTSIHNGNTEKIARTMAEALDAKLVKPNEIKTDELSRYDLIGFGSGIYSGKHHKSLLDLVSKLQGQNNKKAFIFSTRGLFPISICHKALKKQLSEKGFNITGEFSCKGFDDYGPFKLIGGINKNKPDEKDLDDAKEFVIELNG